MTPLDIIMAGINALMEYLSAHVLTCLIPAFFIAGAIAVFISKQSILKYFGANTKKYISYSIASVSGAILAVCSCTVLPLFTGIYKRGDDMKQKMPWKPHIIIAMIMLSTNAIANSNFSKSFCFTF